MSTVIQCNDKAGAPKDARFIIDPRNVTVGRSIIKKKD